MENLNFLADWGRKKELAWSGTTYSLYKSLAKYYKIKNVNVGIPLFFKVARKILRINFFKLGFYQKLFYQKKCKNLKGKVFQFSEIKFDDKNTNTFIYQDLTFSYLKYMKENLPEIFAKSGFSAVEENLLQKNCAMQNDYYKSCSGIFTMGNWIKDFLLDQGISKDKIFVVGGGYKCRGKFNKKCN